MEYLSLSAYIFSKFHNIDIILGMNKLISVKFALTKSLDSHVCYKRFQTLNCTVREDQTEIFGPEGPNRTGYFGPVGLNRTEPTEPDQKFRDRR